METPNIPNPPKPWDQQPGESAKDYLDLLAWLKCDVRRPLRTVAAKLNLRPGRLRRLSSRHRWRVRSLAYDAFRVESARTELDRLVKEECCSKALRVKLFREEEWALHEEMIKQARQALNATRFTRRRVPTLYAIARLFDLASLLGRRSCDVPLDDSPPQPSPPSTALSVQAAIQKIYGSPSPVPPGNTSPPPPPTPAPALPEPKAPAPTPAPAPSWPPPDDKCDIVPYAIVIGPEGIPRLKRIGS